MVAIREATLEDAGFVIRLSDKIESDKSDDRGAKAFYSSEAFTVTEHSINHVIETESCLSVIASFDDVDCGVAIVTTDNDVAVVELIATDPEFRELGVGEAMLDKVIDWAREQNCNRIDSYALPGDRETKNFFESAGIKARLLVVSKEL